MNSPINIDEPTEIELKARQAEERLDALKIEADELEAEARSAIEAFAHDPTPDTLSAREISAQKAKNARDRATAYAESIGELLGEKARSEQRRRLAYLRNALDWRDTIVAGPSFKITELCRHFSKALQTEIDELARHLDRRNALVPEALDLERRANVGDGRNHGVATLGSALELIQGQLQKEFGGASALNGGNPAVKITSRLTANSGALVAAEIQVVASGVNQRTLFG